MKHTGYPTPPATMLWANMDTEQDYVVHDGWGFHVIKDYAIDKGGNWKRVGYYKLWRDRPPREEYDDVVS
jgi:hypothetical protein